MLRWLYIQLLWAHPAGFRHRFGDEMLEAFDYARGAGEHRRLMMDGLVSLFRQWVLRPEFHRTWESATASGSTYELLTFQQIEPYKPSRFALAQGGLLAILLLLGVVDAINHGGGKIRTFLIGMHRPSFGLIKVDRMEGGALNTTIENGHESVDPWRPFARSYFRMIHVLSALDADGDLTISATEIAGAPAALSRLDLNHDGKLSAEECGFLLPGDFDGDIRTISRHRQDFMRTNPILDALDTDHDGQISAAELASSPISLLALDIMKDGKLTPYELIPSQPLSRAASLMTRFDLNDAGVIPVPGQTSEGSDTTIRGILVAADRNHDGLVTRGELIVQFAARPEGTVLPVQVPRTTRQKSE